MVYVGCILIIIMSAYIGKYISNKYVYKDKFYQFLVGLCVYLKSNIGFNHTKIEQLFDDYIKSYKTEFNNEVNLFKKICLQYDLEVKEISYVLKNINKEEREVIISRVKQIGNNEEKFEMEKLDQFMEYCKYKQKEYENQRKNMQPLCYKLSLAIGSVICILII